MSMRMEKVNNQIKRRIMEIIQSEIDDPSIGMVSITRVETTSDLKQSRVYFSVLNDDFDRITAILKRMSGFIRKELAKRIRIKILPNLVFIPDDSIRYSIHMYEKVEEVIHAEENNKRDKKS